VACLLPFIKLAVALINEPGVLAVGMPFLFAIETPTVFTDEFRCEYIV
jgi:hypothetical protein